MSPTDHANLQVWTWKTVFLVAITSATRASELQALDSCPELLHCTTDRAVLCLNPAFLLKVPTPEHLNREVMLQAFYPHPKSSLERAYRLLCPVHALEFVSG